MFNLKRLFKSFSYAWRGFFKVLREEQNLKIQTIFGVIVILAGIFFSINRYEWILIFLAIGLVLSMEIVNSAVERISDVLKPRINTYVKEIKDIMAAAVMMTSILAVIIGCIIFLPYLFELTGLGFLIYF